MVFKSLNYLLKRKKYRPHFGKDDIIIEDIVLNPVHFLPEVEWRENQEADFWMDDKSDFYLLTLCNSGENSVTLGEDEINKYRYIIIRVPVKDISRTLKNVIHELKKFSYAEKLTRKQQTYPFFISSGKE